MIKSTAVGDFWGLVCDLLYALNIFDAVRDTAFTAPVNSMLGRSIFHSPPVVPAKGVHLHEQRFKLTVARIVRCFASNGIRLNAKSRATQNACAGFSHHRLFVVALPLRWLRTR